MTKRTILITGGSSGIGLETARRFLGQGDDVVVLDRQAAPVDAPTITVDLTDPASIAAAADHPDAPEHIDVLCNVAGVSGTAGTSTVLAVNFFAPRHVVETFAPRLRTGGAVVNVASTSGWYWWDHLADVNTLVNSSDPAAAIAALGIAEEEGYLAYNRAKEALIMWTTLAAQQYFGRFRLNTVSPGPVETPLLPSFYESMGADELDPLIARSGRAGTPREIADVIGFLASDQSRWINGTDIVTDFGAEAFLGIQDRLAGLSLPAPVFTKDTSHD